MRAQREGEPSGRGRQGATHHLHAPRVVGSRRRARTCGPRHVRRTQHTVGTGYTDSCACEGGPGPAAIIIMAGYLYGFAFFRTVSELFQNTATLFQNSFRTVSEVSEQGLLRSWFQKCFKSFRNVSEQTCHLGVVSGHGNPPGVRAQREWAGAPRQGHSMVDGEQHCPACGD